MMVDYDVLQKEISEDQKELFGYTVLENPYIPITPYREQALCMMDESDYRLAGGSAYSGKSLLLAAFACQFLMFKDYRCLILRNTYDQVTSTGGVVDKLRGWLLDEDRLGDYVCTENMRDKCFIAPTGGRIYYNYCNRVAEMDKFRGNSFSTIIVDEASEMDYQVLDFLPRSLRSPKSCKIPERYILASNPSMHSGADYLKQHFINSDGEFPYFQMDFRMNPYIDSDTYDKRLSTMDPLQQAFMRYGDWDFVVDEGMLITEEDYKNVSVPMEEIDPSTFEFGVIGVDLASTGHDLTSFSSMMYTSEGHVILYDNVLIEDSLVEQPLIDFIRDQPLVDILVFEKEGGSSAEYTKRHFEHELEEVQRERQFFIEFKHVGASKFERARPFASGIRRQFIKIPKNLPNYVTLLKQLMYVTPDKKKMSTYKSPDMLDSFTIGYNHLDSIVEIR